MSAPTRPSSAQACGAEATDQTAEIGAHQIAAALGNPPPTDEQCQIIEASPVEPLLVVAGAGSGKTETMAARVVWLVANHLVEPDQVLGLTFTRKAATELAERIARRLRRLEATGLWTPLALDSAGAEPLGGIPTVSTYHSYAGRIVREHGLRLGVEPESRLLTEAAAWQYAAEVVARYDGDTSQINRAESSIVSAVVSLAGELAEHLREPEDLADYLVEFEQHMGALPLRGNARSPLDAKILEVLRNRRAIMPMVRAYLDLKRSRDALDFADQVALAARLARTLPAVGAGERQRFRAVLLDEYQDTSEAQLVLLRSLFASGRAAAVRSLAPAGAVGAGAEPPAHKSGDGQHPEHPPETNGEGKSPEHPRERYGDALSVEQSGERYGDEQDAVPAVRVTAVGDPHQSIYGWRGASANTLQRFPEEFRSAAGPARILPLTTSWRNDEAILNVANRTARQLTSAIVRPLRAREGAGRGAVQAGRYLTVEDESAAVASWVASRWWSPSGRRTGATAAVLCRKRAQFPLLVEALEARGLPVEVVGLGGLLLTPEVNDVVCLLWAVQDPTRGDRLMRLLTGPLCRLGPADLDGLATWARAQLSARHSGDSGPVALPGFEALTVTEEFESEGSASSDGSDADESGLVAAPRQGQVRDQAPESAERASIIEALDDLPPPEWAGSEGQWMSQPARQRVAALGAIVKRLRRLAGLPLAELVGEAERALGLDIEVLARPEYSGATARAHLDAFADVAAQFSVSADRPTLGGFLAWLDAALVEERGLDAPTMSTSTDAVQVLTVHAAKGLEWDVVAIPGLVDASFPAREGGAQSKADGAQWSVTPPSDKGWCSGLDGVPYDLRGDVDGLPFLPWRTSTDSGSLRQAMTRFEAEGGRHGLAEERRLAYVAFTRARVGLLLTAAVWADSKTPKVTSPFLLELLEGADRDDLAVSRLEWSPMPPTPDQVAASADPPHLQQLATNPRLATPESAVWPTLVPSESASRRSEIAAGARLVQLARSPARSAVESGDGSFGADRETGRQETLGDGLAPDLRRDLELVLAERRTSVRSGDPVVEVPRHLSASSVVQLATDPDAFALALRRPMPSGPALAARRGTAFHAWVEQYYGRAAMVDVIELPGSADEDADLDADLPLLKELFLASEWAARLPDEVEVAIETTLDGFALRGRLDAVFARDDGGFTVVDWKTGNEPTGKAARLQALQLGTYALAYARLRDLPVARVDGAFYYAQTGRTVYPTLPRQRALLSLLRTVPT